MNKLIAQHEQKIKFLIAGIWNTIVGYALFIGMYYFWYQHIHYMVIMIASNVISVTNAFISYKFFVFRSKGFILHEYLRFYIVYAFSVGANTIILPVLVELLKIHPVFAQGLAIFITVILSYFGHKNFSFKQVKEVVS